jgi:sulfonate transport system ATP-binding protein
MSGEIELKGVGKRFNGGPPVLAEIDLEVRAGKIVSVVGPSGCGKSTLLRILAGLDRNHEGQVLVRGRAVDGPTRTVGFMFQEPRLLPWLSVERNVIFGLDREQKPHGRDRVAELLSNVQLDGSEKLFPRELSGGMMQRTALARALAARPAVLLLDEPFSALDAFTRMHLQELVLGIWERAQLIMVLVTHEIDEALYLSDRVVVLSERPARVAEIIPVPIARPRDRREPALLALRGHLLEKLRLAGRRPNPLIEYEI